MINFFIKTKNKRLAFLQAGMTYVELIVVLGIFSVLSTVVIYSYNEFQAKVDIKNLASDIALKIVEAQRSSLSGNLPPGFTDPAWKPAYGILFNDTKSFVYFADLNNNGAYDSGETLDTISIATRNSITGTETCPSIGDCSINVGAVSVAFQRPNSGAKFADSNGFEIGGGGSQHIRVKIASERYSTMMATISIYPSGRIQVD